MKKLITIACMFSLAFLIIGCARGTGQVSDFNATGTPSPLNTSANSWTNVNPSVQGQMRAGAIAAGHGR